MDYTIVESFNQRLKKKGLTVAFAESITAGLLCSTVASIFGASSILKGGIVTYDAKLKTRLLNVSKSTLDFYTAESLQTTIEMARGLETLELGADIYAAITGVASAPSNDYEIKSQVGDVFVAVVFNKQIFSKKYNFSGERNYVREQAVLEMLKFILEIIDNQSPH